MILEKEDREKFAAYCERQADSCRDMAKQLRSNCVHISGELIAKKETAKAKAYAIVAMDLRSVEDFTI